MSLEFKSSRSDREIISIPSKGAIYKVALCRKHKFEKPPQEVIQEWKSEVDRIISMISQSDSEDYQKLSEILGNDPSEKDLQLWAIGKFVNKVRAPYPGDWHYYKELASWKTHAMNDFGKNNERIDTCLHSALVVQLLADEYGIPGSIVGGYSTRDSEPSKVFGAHYLWKEDSDTDQYRMMDPHLFPHIAGFVRDKEHYAQEIKIRNSNQSVLQGCSTSIRHTVAKCLNHPKQD